MFVFLFSGVIARLMIQQFVLTAIIVPFSNIVFFIMKKGRPWQKN
jgi:hypothetical protein